MIAIPEVSKKDSLLSENGWHLLKQQFCIFLSPSAHMKGDDLPACRIHDQPQPLLISFIAYKAPHFICLAPVKPKEYAFLFLI
nr:hypothetical protein [Rufibacter sp. XAAS-G3-1]